MGETVEKVLVDGEEFFGDDPGMAVKNLRADAVKEVQVFDKKSDQAEFTGIDDGKTQKTINLKLKEDRKKGYFGKVDVAGGLQKNIDNRYNDNLMYGSFKGKRKITGFFLNGNTGQDGLSWQDKDKFGSDDNFSMSVDDDGNTMFSWNGGSNDDEINIDAANGYMTNVNAGIQYSNKWNDKKTLNFSPKFNSQLYSNLKNTFTQTRLGGDTTWYGNTAENVNINRHNLKIKGTYDIKIDSMNTLKLTASTNFYHTESEDISNLKTTDETGANINASDRTVRTKSDKYALGATILFMHKFKKARRTFSISTDWNDINTDGINFVKQLNQDYVAGSINSLDQMKGIDKNTQNLSTKLVYTEPLSKKYSLELAYQVLYNYGHNNQQVYSYSPASGKYDQSVDSVSNKFNQKILQNIPSAKINFANKKLKVNVGAGFGFTNFDLQDVTFNKDYRRNFTNFYPSASLNYTYKPNHNFRINYNGNTKQPTINQLQPLRNNDDQFNQYLGNPNLKPSFTNNINVSHNAYNFIKDIGTYLSVNATQTSNGIANNRIITAGKTITQPINTDGNMSVNIWAGTWMRIKKIDTRFNIGPSFSFNKYNDVINSVKNLSKTTGAGLSFYASKAKEKKYDITLQNEFNFNKSVTAQNINNTHYTTNTLSVYATVYYKKVWSLISDYQYNSRQKVFATDNNLNNHLLNARIQRTFKNDEFTVYFTVKDILNQNIGIDRNFYSNIYTEERNQRLKRFFMLGFTWNFKNKATQPSK